MPESRDKSWGVRCTRCGNSWIEERARPGAELRCEACGIQFKTHGPAPGSAQVPQPGPHPEPESLHAASRLTPGTVAEGRGSDVLFKWGCASTAAMIAVVIWCASSGNWLLGLWIFGSFSLAWILTAFLAARGEVYYELLGGHGVRSGVLKLVVGFLVLAGSVLVHEASSGSLMLTYSKWPGFLAAPVIVLWGLAILTKETVLRLRG